MNRHTAAATAVSAAILAATLTACQPQAETASTSGNQAAANNTQNTTAPADPSCTVEFGPNQAGIYATSHKVDASVYLKCTGAPDNVSVSLTLAYAPFGTSMQDDQEAAGADYENAQASYTTSARCTPGQYALHVMWTANVNGAALGDQTWGKTADVTAADCARN